MLFFLFIILLQAEKFHSVIVFFIVLYRSFISVDKDTYFEKFEAGRFDSNNEILQNVDEIFVGRLEIVLELVQLLYYIKF